MKRRLKNTDMLTGSLYKSILLFTVPIALSSILQQLFNAADTAIVGYFDTADSLAAVGTNGEIIALIVSLSSGLSVGVNVLVAKQIGEKRNVDINSVVITVFVMATIIGGAGLFIGNFCAEFLLYLIKTPENIMDASVLYLKIYFMGYPFLMIFDFGSAILRAQGNSRCPFIVLTLSGVLNVFLNAVFVVIFNMGVVGVAIATMLSNILSACLVFFRIKKDCHGLFKSRFDFKLIVPILKIGVPSAVQGAVFCFANIFVQASVNSFGSVAIAGSTIAMNFEYFAYYVITAFGQSATTFVCQNYAANQYERCKKILWICVTFSFLISLLIIVPLVVFHSFFVGIFSSDNGVMQQAFLRIVCILLFEPLCCFYEIPAGVLRGMGYSLYPAAATITGTCLLRIIWIFTVFKNFHELKILYSVFPISWVVTVLIMFAAFVFIKPLKPYLTFRK